MWAVIRYFLGACLLEIDGASPELALNRLTKERIPFWDVERTGPVTCRVRVLEKDYPAACQAITLGQCQCRLVSRKGFRQWAGGLLSRPGIWLAAMLAAALPLLGNQFVWTVDVSGNQHIPTEKLLQQLEQVGVYPGAYGPAIVSQQVKNQMLNRIPELEWLAVNRQGGRAHVLVKERVRPPELTDTRQPCDLIAGKTGLITRVQVYAGTVLCREGQTVLQGQQLVSGFYQRKVNLQRSHSQGEIYARTWRRYRSVTPQPQGEKRYTGREIRRFAVQLGKKRKNLPGSSGIVQGNYDKIQKRTALTLPGGIPFPLFWITEIYREYTLSPSALSEDAACQIARDAANARAKEEMVAGTVLQCSAAPSASPGGIQTETVLECEEMIARTASADPEHPVLPGPDEE